MRIHICVKLLSCYITYKITSEAQRKVIEISHLWITGQSRINGNEIAFFTSNSKITG